MIPSILSEIENKFNDIDRRIYLCQGKVHRFFDKDQQHAGLPYKEEGPSDASLETLEYLEPLEKEMDSHITHMQDSNASLESFCEEANKQIQDLVHFLVSVMDYASNNYEISFPTAIKETLNTIISDKDVQEEVKKDKVEEGESNQSRTDEASSNADGNDSEESSIDRPNPLHFGISKLGLEKMGFSFYSKDSVQNKDACNKGSSIGDPPVLLSSKKRSSTQNENSYNKDSSIGDPPVLLSSKKRSSTQNKDSSIGDPPILLSSKKRSSTQNEDSSIGDPPILLSSKKQSNTRNEGLCNTDSSIGDPPILLSSKKQTDNTLLSVTDYTESPFEMKSRQISTPSPPPLREKPQEISPGLFVRVRKSKGKKSVSPEVPTLSIPLNNNAPATEEIFEQKDSLEAQKENMNDSFGPPAAPKLFTRQFI